MNSILEQYQKQVQDDRVGETYDHENAENNLQMTDEEYEYYKQTIDDLREQMYDNVPKEMKSRIKNKSYPKSLIKETPVEEIKDKGTNVREQTMDDNGEFHSKGDFDMNSLNITIEELGCIDPSINKKRFVIIHAKCPFCGEEIKSLIPTMYNPFNYKPTTPYKCEHCGNQYHNDFGYPHIAIMDENNYIITNHVR